MHWKKRILRAQKLSNKPFNEYILVMSWELVFLDNSYSRKRYWEQCENVLTLFLLFFAFNYEILSILKIFEKCLLALFSLVISLGLKRRLELTISHIFYIVLKNFKIPTLIVLRGLLWPVTCPLSTVHCDRKNCPRKKLSFFHIFQFHFDV